MFLQIVGLIGALMVVGVVSWNHGEMSRWRLGERIFFMIIFLSLVVLYSGMALGVFK